MKSLVAISWPHAKGSVNVLGWHGEIEMLVTWKQVMKSLLMGICTTFAECKTVMTAVLTVMSSMDPHTISWNLGWVRFCWELVSLVV
jgi:hypothetical protein